MADTIAISCPECDKAISVAAELEGKKIRCKACGHVFPVKAAASKGIKTKPDPKPAKSKAPDPKPAKGKAKDKAVDARAVQAKPPPKAAPKPAPKPDADEDEEDANPYGVTGQEEMARCPHCANEMESAEAIICLTCGYNTQTREMGKTIKAYETTGGEIFVWLLPGILAVLAIPLVFFLLYFYMYELPPLIYDSWDKLDEKYNGDRGKMFKDDDASFTMWAFHWGIFLWVVVAGLFACFYLGKFAFKRLILHPNPPEKVKKG